MNYKLSYIADDEETPQIPLWSVLESDISD